VSAVPSTIRVVEVLAALSLTTDLGSGVAFEKGLQSCLVGEAFARELRLPESDRRGVFQAALLRGIGCTGHSSENAAMFVDDVAFQAMLKVLDPARPEVFRAQMSEFGRWAGLDRQPILAQRFLNAAPTVGPQAARAGCEVSRALGSQLGLEAVAVAALDEVYDRWDGAGIPSGRAGDALSIHARIVHVAEQAVLAHAAGGLPVAVAEVRSRAGGQLDPDLATAFCASGEALLSALDQADLLAAVVRAEPGPPARIPFDDLDRLCVALATVADLKGRWLLGHSTQVADLATSAAFLLGNVNHKMVRAAALVHDLGRVAVSSEVWDRPGALGAADWERVRLHSYWTARVLQRSPATAPLAVDASSHHERCDGSGYHRGVAAGDLSLAARLIAAADVLAALTEPRPYRPAQVTDFFVTLSTYTVHVFQVLRMLVADDAAVAQIVIDASMPGGGRFRDEELHLWTFGADGRIVALRHYIDTAKHLAAARGEDTVSQ
jgi:HD-GYP domain-containing protein (c-di-GMP phosphodiesterase class II)